jgi:hypothetical protein
MKLGHMRSCIGEETEMQKHEPKVSEQIWTNQKRTKSGPGLQGPPGTPRAGYKHWLRPREERGEALGHASVSLTVPEVFVGFVQFQEGTFLLLHWITDWRPWHGHAGVTDPLCPLDDAQSLPGMVSFPVSPGT